MTVKQKERSVLVVDDDELVQLAVCQALASEGYLVIGASSGREALSMASQQKFDAAIVDLRMPGMSGVELLPLLKGMCPNTIAIILTAVQDGEELCEAIADSGEFLAYIEKPCRTRDLYQTLERAFDRYSGSPDSYQTCHEGEGR